MTFKEAWDRVYASRGADTGAEELHNIAEAAMKIEDSINWLALLNDPLASFWSAKLKKVQDSILDTPASDSSTD